MTRFAARPRRLLVPLLVAALVLAGCGRSAAQERKLIARSDSQEVQATLDRLDRALESGACTRAESAVETLRKQVDAFRPSTDAKLVANARDWVDHLETQVPQDCVDAKPEDTPTPEPSPSSTPEEEKTPEATSTPEATKTPAPTATSTPTPTSTPGGKSGGSDGGVTGGAQPGEFTTP